MAALDETNTLSTEEQVSLIESMMPLFEEFLTPSDVLSFLTVNGDLKEDVIEMENRGERHAAVRKLMSSVLDDPSGNGVSEFIYSLRELALQRGNKTRSETSREKLKREQYEVLLQMTEQDNLEQMDNPLQIIYAVRRDLSPADYIKVKAVYTIHDCVAAAFRRLFRYLPREHSDWPLRFMDAARDAGIKMMRRVDPELHLGDNCFSTSTGERRIDVDRHQQKGARRPPSTSSYRKTVPKTRRQRIEALRNWRDSESSDEENPDDNEIVLSNLEHQTRVDTARFKPRPKGGPDRFSRLDKNRAPRIIRQPIGPGTTSRFQFRCGFGRGTPPAE